MYRRHKISQEGVSRKLSDFLVKVISLLGMSYSHLTYSFKHFACDALAKVVSNVGINLCSQTNEFRPLVGRILLHYSLGDYSSLVHWSRIVASNLFFALKPCMTAFHTKSCYFD